MKPVVISALSLVFAAAGLVAQDQTPIFKSVTKTVPIYATVTSKNGQLVPGLGKEAFQIYDNSKLVPATLFANEIQNIKVVMMLDVSGSMTANLEFLKDAAEQFIIRLLPKDIARVGAFSDVTRIKLSPAFSSNRDDLIRQVKEIDYGNGTALWDAVDLSMTALAGLDGRRVVLIFTDGDDTDSRQHNLKDCMTRAQNEEFMIYAIGFHSKMMGQVTNPDGGLKKIANETGGGYFDLRNTADLNTTFTRVEQELHSQYVLGFQPSVLDGKMHSIDVKMVDPQLVVRGRRSYIATPDAEIVVALAAATIALFVWTLRAQQASTSVPPPQGATFRSNQRTTAVYTTVVGPDGHLVTDLKKENFEVYDDGVKQDLAVFANDIQPITLVAMLDLSGSMSGNIPLLRRAATQMAAHLGKDDRARFGEFGDHVNMVTPEFTNDVNSLIRNLYLDLEPGGSTPLWNAVDVAMNALAEQPGRRVVLVFTDGYDTSSNVVTLNQDVKRAQEDEFMIYSVGLASHEGGYGGGHGYGFGGHAGSRSGGGSWSGGGGGESGEPDPGLKTLSEETGGGYFRLQAATELDATFSRILEELHHQYILGFVPRVLDGRVHTNSR